MLYRDMTLKNKIKNTLNALLDPFLVNGSDVFDVTTLNLNQKQWDMIKKNVPFIAHYPDSIMKKLEKKMEHFLQQVDFIGSTGFKINEEMVLTIAAQASLLIFGENNKYNNTGRVLIYPNKFRTSPNDLRVGLSYNTGIVYLSWKHVKNESNISNNDNISIVLHQFADQIYFDIKDDSFLDKAYKRYIKKCKDSKDSYQSMNFDEIEDRMNFFAFSTDRFFTSPNILLKEEPELYQKLSDMFGHSPVEYIAEPVEEKFDFEMA